MMRGDTGPPSPRLAGTFDWDPYGESMLAVLEKIGSSNVLVGHSLFDTVGLRISSSRVTRDPDVGGAERYARLEELAGWSPSTLRASVHATYRAPGAPPLDMHGVLATRAAFVRFCPDCAETGLHLALFQVSEILVCPIHDRALEERCPRCLRALRHYSFTLEELAAIGCGNCGWEKRLGEAVGKNDPLRAAKRTVVEDLVRWMEDLRALTEPDGGSIRELTVPDSIHPLTHYHALVPGPEWIGRCMHAGSRTRVRIVPLRGAPTLSARQRKSSVSGDPAWAADRTATTMVHRTRRLQRRLSMMFELVNARDGAFLSTTGYRRRLVDEDASVAALALRWWVRFLTPFPLHDVPLELDAPVQIAPESGSLWRLWKEILEGPRSSLPRAVLPSRITPLLAARWTDLFLEALYLSLIGRASLFSCGQVEPGRILGAAQQTGSMPLLVLRGESRHREIVEVTNTAPTSDFVALFRSGYTGFEEERLVGAFGTDPVHDLIALPAKERRRSMEGLYQLAGRPGGR